MGGRRRLQYASQSYPLLMRKSVISLNASNETALWSVMMMMFGDEMVSE